ncbi:unnamed protein product [Protopolystoma xenopodis]|uniref:Uncharacterized protein n=1 Tax=Protopolystoma xenopodis TaxID=117903 RepID=A0A448WQJ2_9PLAT|nr:unnamed protein product [Protopolystoma xenopodis]
MGSRLTRSSWDPGGASFHFRAKGTMKIDFVDAWRTTESSWAESNSTPAITHHKRSIFWYKQRRADCSCCTNTTGKRAKWAKVKLDARFPELWRSRKRQKRMTEL